MNFNLNTERGSKLGYVRGGKYDKEIIHISDTINNKDKNIDVDEMAYLIENLYKNMGGRVNFKQLEELQNAIIDKKKPTNRTISRYYDQAMKILDKSKGKEIILDDDSKFYPMFDDEKERQVFMITGMSGSGKSTYTGQLINTYNKTFTQNKVFVFSNKDSDPAIDKEDIKRIPIDEELLNDPIHLDELSNSLVVFLKIGYTL